MLCFSYILHFLDKQVPITILEFSSLFQLDVFYFCTLAGYHSIIFLQGLEESLKFWLKVVLLKVDSYQRSFALDTTFHSHPEVESSDQVIHYAT